MKKSILILIIMICSLISYGQYKYVFSGGVKHTNGRTVIDDSLRVCKNVYVWGDYLSHLTLFNSRFGTQAGAANTTGSKGTFIGYQAGYSNTTGRDNTCIGYQAGYANVGNFADNTYIGYKTGYSTIGSGNVFVGANAGLLNADGINNVIIGTSANDVGITGSNNIMIGFMAGRNNAVDDNIFMGYQSGLANTTGTSNTFLGYQAGYTNSTGAGNVFLGYQGGYYETASNSFYLHNGLGVTNLATGKTNSLLYGVFDAVAANQTLTMNIGTLYIFGRTITDIIPLNEATGDLANSTTGMTNVYTDALVQKGLTRIAEKIDIGDDLTYTFPVGMTVRGYVWVDGNDASYSAQFFILTDGTCTIQSGGANVVNTDTDAKICFLDGGAYGTLKNRLNATKTYNIVYEY